MKKIQIGFTGSIVDDLKNHFIVQFKNRSTKRKWKTVGRNFETHGEATEFIKSQMGRWIYGTQMRPVMVAHYFGAAISLGRHKP